MQLLQIAGPSLQWKFGVAAASEEQIGNAEGTGARPDFFSAFFSGFVSTLSGFEAKRAHGFHCFLRVFPV